MNKLLRDIIGRAVGAAVGALTGFLAAKGIGEVSTAASTELTGVLTNAVMLAGYGIGHKVTDRKKVR